jgi:hypothetical protein
MAIPETQLDTWSHQGAVAGSGDTYQTVQNALSTANAPYAGKSYEVFLQGSYGNDTNIYAESDVDVVIRLDAFFGYYLDALPPDQQENFRRLAGVAGYAFAEFKQGVGTRLSSAFAGQNVSFGTKTFKIKPSGSRRSADVLVCYQYRYYTRFVNHSDCSYVAGVTFPTAAGEWIRNYPKQHSENCTAKHQATKGWYKPMVRIFKNIRTRMVADRLIADGIAPSYYIEGLLYNVPDDQFGKNYRDTFCNCVNWLMKTDRAKCLCANQMYYLLGNSKVQWESRNCDQFLNAAIRLWQNWR